jgi:hypothetical protein
MDPIPAVGDREANQAGRRVDPRPKLRRRHGEGICTSFKAAVAIPENGHSVSFGEEAFSVRDPKKSPAWFQSVRVDDVAGRKRDQQAAFVTASVGL